ncbi:MAG: hypothetical protein MUP63_01370 [Candidatus Nanohaloarchaeota archaeon QJJ-7]|nr:hypothetical protein [Candidatus Nanohaloarchaeota archaeon QJJ-7]
MEFEEDPADKIKSKLESDESPERKESSEDSGLKGLDIQPGEEKVEDQSSPAETGSPERKEASPEPEPSPVRQPREEEKSSDGSEEDMASKRFKELKEEAKEEKLKEMEEEEREENEADIYDPDEEGNILH